MLPLLSLHPLAAQRGDRFRPELLALLRRLARSGLSASFATVTEGAYEPVSDPASNQAPVLPLEADAATPPPPVSVAYAA